MTGYATCMGETKDLHRNFLWKPEDKRLPLTYILVDNITLELKNWATKM
jgi:hypothetical protein